MKKSELRKIIRKVIIENNADPLQKAIYGGVEEGPLDAAKDCKKCLDKDECCHISGTSSNPVAECVECGNAPPRIDMDKDFTNDEFINEYSKMLEEPKKTKKGRNHWWQFWREPLSFDESKQNVLNKEWSAEQCSDSWEEITGMGGNVQGMSIFRKFCCRRGWKCCTRKRPKRNPCWD